MRFTPTAPRDSENWDCVSLTPLLKQFKGYSRASAAADLKAGFNVAVLSFPINMAYALVAGLPIYYGIFGGILSAAVALFFCRSIYITLGPSNASAVMLLSSFAAAGFESEIGRMAALPAIILFVGVFLMLASLSKTTFLIAYISRTVIIAYVTVGALLIVANQTKNVLGFSFPEGVFAATLADTVAATIKSLKYTQPWSVAMAFATLAIFLPIKYFFKKLPAEGITLIICAAICCWLTESAGVKIDRLTAITAGEWKLTVPNFDIIGIREAALSALAIALLATIEAVSIGKSLASTKADRFPVNQEIFALGAANVACAFGSGTVASGSLTRSTISVFSGAKTTLFNLFSILITLGILTVFGSAIQYVPKATLAMIVVYTSLTLIKPRNIKLALMSTKSDAFVFAATFLVGVFSTLDDAIYAGIGMSLILFLKKASTPEVVEYSIRDDGELRKVGDKSERSAPELSIVHVEGNMFFGASDVLQNQLRRISAEPNLKVLILKLRNAINFDATSVMDIDELARRMKSGGRTLMLCEVRPDVMRVLKGSGVYAAIGGENVFENDDDNPTLSAARAIKFARTKFENTPIVDIYATGKVR